MVQIVIQEVQRLYEMFFLHFFVHFLLPFLYFCPPSFFISKLLTSFYPSLFLHVFRPFYLFALPASSLCHYSPQNHSQEHSLSFSPRFKCDTTFDWLNQKLCYIQMLLNIKIYLSTNGILY